MTRLLNQEFILYWKFEHSPIIASGEEIKLDFIINSTQIIIDLDFSWVAERKVIATVCFLIKKSGNISHGHWTHHLQQGESEIQYSIVFIGAFFFLQLTHK